MTLVESDSKNFRTTIVPLRGDIDSQIVFNDHRFTSLFSSPPWIEVLRRTYGFDVSAAFGVSDNGSSSAILFSHISDLRGERIVSLPFSDYCDPLVEDFHIWSRLIESVLVFGVPITFRCLRNDVPGKDRHFQIVSTSLWHGVDLTRSEHELWSSIAAPARQNVRKAQRNRVTVREAMSIDAVRIFHQMHCALRKRKYRLLAQSVTFFENIYQQFSQRDGIVVLLAEVGGVPIAGILLLVWGNTLYYKFNASIANGLGANDLLAWEALRLGRRCGLARMDFGRSDHHQPGLIRYKRKYASEEREILTLQHVPRNYEDKRGEEATRLLNRVTEWLTLPEVPDEVSRTAGDQLYRYFC